MAAALRHLPAPRAAGGRGKAPLLSWLGGPGRRTAAAARPEEAMAANPIVTSKQREEVVHGVPTEVVCTAFSNSILVVVTQYGKLGTLVYVDPNTIGDNIGRPSLTTKVLLGKDEPLVHVCAKNLVAFVSQEAGNKPVLLAMALKDKTMEGIQALREVIRSCQVW
ncbi:proteasome assembly chaperone 3 isoform X1 [Anas acuta]|uniref:Proteasome assembly chaperone 3 n=2 Tax=Anatidae TaxID=8830 RepID=A0A8B9BN59_9AVES|nr:proteasome assembly chaperone 3 isoform X1 [Anser cygnoides]|eukprot:XP_027325054.1 proteasome assembly chaperone 3 isoform X2 [Anas platyrhynchos]